MLSIHFNSLQEIPLLQYSVRRAQNKLEPKFTPKRHTPSVSRFFLQKAALTAAIMLLVLPYAFDGSANAAGSPRGAP